MPNFDKYFDKLLKNLEDLVKNKWKDFLDAAEADGKTFLLETKEDLKRWTRLLANGDLTREEFEFLVGSKEDLLKLKALQRLGLTKVRIQMFQTAVIGLIIDTAFDFFLCYWFLTGFVSAITRRRDAWQSRRMQFSRGVE